MLKKAHGCVILGAASVLWVPSVAQEWLSSCEAFLTLPFSGNQRKIYIYISEWMTYTRITAPQNTCVMLTELSVCRNLWKQRIEEAMTAEVFNWKNKALCAKTSVGLAWIPIPLYTPEFLLLFPLKRTGQSFTFCFALWKCQVQMGITVVGWEELGSQLGLSHWPCPCPDTFLYLFLYLWNWVCHGIFWLCRIDAFFFLACRTMIKLRMRR